MKKLLALVISALLLFTGLPFAAQSAHAAKQEPAENAYTGPATHAVPEGTVTVHTLREFAEALQDLPPMTEDDIFPDLRVTRANAKTAAAALKKGGDIRSVSDALKADAAVDRTGDVRGIINNDENAASFSGQDGVMSGRAADSVIADRASDFGTADLVSLKTLETQARDEGYDVITGSDSLVISRPYQTARLLAEAEYLPDTFGATAVIGGYRNLWVLQYENEDAAREAAERLSALDGVLWAAPDSVVSAQDEFLSWGYGQEHMDQMSFLSWYQSELQSDETVTVAVLDTGAMYDHPFLADRMDTEHDYDFVNNDDDAYEDHYHGTHVCGTIVDGTPESVKIVPIKVLNSTGSGAISGIVSALWYCKELGVDVVNMSLGGTGSNVSYNTVIDSLTACGTIVCVAAGNSSMDAKYFSPANVESAVTVAAVGENHRYADFSNFGSLVDLAAPGVNIVSAYPTNGRGSTGRYAALSGTSMASPHAAAAAACLKLYRSDITAADMVGLLSNNGKPTWNANGSPTDVKLIDMSGVTEPGAAAFYLSMTKKLLYPGQDYRLSAISLNGEVISWSSTDPEVCTVTADGMLHAAGIGNCEITAFTSSYSRSCEITVSDIVIRFDEPEFEMYADCYYTVPYYISHSGIPLRWVSSDPEVLSVTNGTVFSHAAGTATVTLTAAPDGIAETSASFTVEVLEFGEWHRNGAPFILSTAQDLLEFSIAWDIGVTGDIVIDPTVEEIDMAGIDWQPIGRYRNFGGKADGSGVPIKNLRCVTPDQEYVGFFGRVAFAEVKNFVIEDAYFVGLFEVGGFCGYLGLHAAVENCHVNGADVQAVLGGTHSDQGCYAGGLFGRAATEKPIVNCSARANVSAERKCAGGFVGCVNGTEIINCAAYGTVTAPSRCGGFAGAASGQFLIDENGRNLHYTTLRNCVCAAQASASIADFNYGSKLLDCYAPAGETPFYREVSTEIVYGEIEIGEFDAFRIEAYRWDDSLILEEESISVIDRLNKNAFALSEGDEGHTYYRWVVKDGVPVLAPESEQTADVAIANRIIRLISGQSVPLIVSAYPAGQTPVFTSDDPAVVSVDASGVVTAVSGGETVIRAELDGKNDFARVYVLGVGDWYDPAADTLYVSSLQDLLDLRAIINEGFENFTGKTLLQTADIDLTGVNWTPIAGNVTSLKFHGDYNGQGHRITGLSSDRYDTDAGLFGKLAGGAVIEDLILDGIRMELGQSWESACLACELGKNCVVRNCMVSGSVFGYDTNIRNHLWGRDVLFGGLVCKNKGEVKNCRSLITVQDFYGYAGGICTYNYRTIDGCLWNGTVSNCLGASGICYASEAGSVIRNCVSVGFLSDYSTGTAGICNKSMGEIVNCANHATIAGDNWYIRPGIAHGYGATPFTVENCVNTGTMRAEDVQICDGTFEGVNLFGSSAVPVPMYAGTAENVQNASLFDPETLLFSDGSSLLDALNAFVDEYNAEAGAEILTHWTPDSDALPVPFAACGHTVTGERVLRLPNCLEDGVAAQACLSCGKILGEETAVPALGHYDTFYDRAPTGCDDPGYHSVTCGRCKLTLSRESWTIPHTPADDYVVTQEATCTRQGIESLYCTVCNRIISQRYEPMLPHEPEERITREAGCFTSGYKETRCKNCNKYFSGESIPAIGHHTPTEGEDEAIPATCTSQAHVRSHCSVCGQYWDHDYTGQSAQHVFTRRVVTQDALFREATCTEPAKYRYSCETCDLIERNTSRYFTDGAALGHAPGEWTEKKPSTCMLAGQEILNCARCGAQLDSRALPLAEHTPETVPGRAATCTQTGLTDGVRCSVCKTTLTAQTVVPLIAHTPETIPGKAATCTQTGLTDGVRCSVCKTTLTEQTVIPTSGHTWDGGRITETATCFSSGVMTFTCTVCGEPRYEPVDPVDHVDANGDGYCDYGCGTCLGSSDPGSQQQSNCVCGQYHTGPLAGIIIFFHKIAYFFKNLLK